MMCMSCTYVMYVTNALEKANTAKRRVFIWYFHYLKNIKKKTAALYHRRAYPGLPWTVSFPSAENSCVMDSFVATGRYITHRLYVLEHFIILSDRLVQIRALLQMVTRLRWSNWTSHSMSSYSTGGDGRKDYRYRTIGLFYSFFPIGL